LFFKGNQNVPKGGKRNGSGRKPGGHNQKTAEVAQQAAADGITPVEVMLKAMRWADGKGDYSAAAGFAHMAAPYCHPRLSAVAHTGGDGGAVRVAFVEEIVDGNVHEDRDEDDTAPPDAGGVPSE
jgi:hypothetical protein